MNIEQSENPILEKNERIGGSHERKYYGKNGAERCQLHRAQLPKPSLLQLITFPTAATFNRIQKDIVPISGTS